MRYKSGDHFEKAIFGRRSGGRNTNYQTFSDSLHAVLDADQVSLYPKTRLGELLFFGVYHKLIRRGVDPSGLRLLRGSDGSGDRWHGVDGFFYLPSIGRWPVTVDLFNLDSRECEFWKKEWFVSSEIDFQNRLFLHKRGMSLIPQRGDWGRIINPEDYSLPKISKSGKPKAQKQRPENDFILTPYYTEDREMRGIFCGLVADFFAKAAKRDFDRHNFSCFGT
jgi:hypothetical protein